MPKKLIKSCLLELKIALSPTKAAEAKDNSIVGIGMLDSILGKGKED